MSGGSLSRRRRADGEEKILSRNRNNIFLPVSRFALFPLHGSKPKLGLRCYILGMCPGVLLLRRLSGPFRNNIHRPTRAYSPVMYRARISSAHEATRRKKGERKKRGEEKNSKLVIYRSANSVRFSLFLARFLPPLPPPIRSRHAHVKYSMFPSRDAGRVSSICRAIVFLRDRIPPNLRSRR